MKRLLPLVLLGLLACGLLPTPRSAPAPTATATLAPTAPAPDAALGSAKNPLILALAPSARPEPDVINAGNVLKSQLEKSTGYKIIIVAPPSESELVKAFADGNAHIGVLSPFAYLMVSNAGNAEAAFARQREGGIFYGAQFIVQSEAGFTSYFDSIKNENTADASVALAQFRDKKPCWTDEFSPSGYVVPLGFLGEANVKTLEPAFVSGHPTVVRAVYARGICDFGATYIDARNYPGLEDEFPDVMKKVTVVWRIPPIIPYETLVFAHGMTIDMRRALERAFVDAISTPQGKSAMQVLYGFDAMQIVQDGQYDEFRKAVKVSGLKLGDLVK
ncbi:MAG: PhnD/SsuA/transferrin family substrate-binding protein [Chloroflexi bacterium]|nr:PhnD/SsuA/transferrin family substrate-binding protein [Chloroflexota bacterium]MBI1855098.1 PhnD/SsuA/transferrin family substrate-binding protein [Chloroflexota bacterium]MBI3339883.1 PhnD/SsuA/transferrin family substrate-binding protein [Chloroflexota bacterium]